MSAGSNIGFTISVHNAGPGVAKAVTLTDPLPTGAGISWSISPANAACNISSNTLSCNFGDMASGATATVHITSPTTAATPCTGLPEHRDRLRRRTTRQVKASASMSVQCPGLNIIKTADATSVNAGEPIGFTITRWQHRRGYRDRRDPQRPAADRCGRELVDQPRQRSLQHQQSTP